MRLQDKYEPKKVMKNVMLWCEEKDCGWKTTIQPEEVFSWHNKSCPKCGKGIIVSDKDIEEFKKLLEKGVGS